MISKIVVTLTVCVAAVGGAIFLFNSVLPLTLNSLKRIRRNLAIKNSKFTLAATITGLHIHPVKSAKGIRRDSLFCGRLGVSASPTSSATSSSTSSASPTSLLIDRGWMVVLGEKHRFVTQRQEPKLVLISVSFDDDTKTMTLHSGEGESVSFPLPPTDPHSPQPPRRTAVFHTATSGLDCGDSVADWLSKFLEKPGHRLLYKAPSQLMGDRNIVETLPHGDINDELKHRTIAYQDNSPILLANMASLGSLNAKLEKRISMTRFRPNIRVDGARAWDEDRWEKVVVCPVGVDPNLVSDSRRVVLRRVSPATRCKVPTVDPETGVMDSEEEPLRTLKKFRLWESVFGKLKKHEVLRAKAVFGASLGIVEEGEIREGDAVWVVKEGWRNKD